MLAAVIGMPGKAHALKRLSSQFIDLNGEAITNATPTSNATGGAAFYDVTVGAPCTANVLYVDVSGTHDDTGTGNPDILLACLVDGMPCNLSQANNNMGPSGWTILRLNFGSPGLAVSGELNFHYTWCVPIKPSCPGGSDDASPVSHSVQLRFGTQFGIQSAIEQIYANIDSEKIKNSALACTQGSP